MENNPFSSNSFGYSSNSRPNFLSSFNEIEKIIIDVDGKVPEVIFIEDSPLACGTNGLNGDTPATTPCSSVHEEEDAFSEEEIFPVHSLNVADQNPRLLHEDNVCKNSIQYSLSESSTVEMSSISDSVSQLSSFTKSASQIVKDFTIPCLNSILSLRTRFASKYELRTRLRNMSRYNKPSRKNLYRFKKKLYNDIDEWEQYLNEQSANEGYIAVENTVDNVSPPKDFTYITQNMYHNDLIHLFDKNYLVGCGCERICTADTCGCPRNSGGVFAYDRNGRVCVKPGTPIYECNSNCSCGMSCRNRVLQRGRTMKVAIFRTSNGCGWGVKTMEPIEKNQLVTEYVGEAIKQEEAEERGKVYDSCGQTYLFDLDFNDGECLYTLDAKNYGNISHFINHSCNPNLNVYAVWVDTLDPNLPRIAFFASREIKIGEELTFDYQMTVSEVGGSGLSPRKKMRIKCHCGASNCRKYLH